MNIIGMHVLWTISPVGVLSFAQCWNRDCHHLSALDIKIFPDIGRQADNLTGRGCQLAISLLVAAIAQPVAIDKLFDHAAVITYDPQSQPVPIRDRIRADTEIDGGRLQIFHLEFPGCLVRGLV